jgi:hypothetical protein
MVYGMQVSFLFTYIYHFTYDPLQIDYNNNHDNSDKTQMATSPPIQQRMDTRNGNGGLETQLRHEPLVCFVFVLFCTSTNYYS